MGRPSMGIRLTEKRTTALLQAAEIGLEGWRTELMHLLDYGMRGRARSEDAAEAAELRMLIKDAEDARDALRHQRLDPSRRSKHKMSRLKRVPQSQVVGNTGSES